MIGQRRPSPRLLNLAILLIVATVALAGCRQSIPPTAPPTLQRTVATWTATIPPTAPPTQPPASTATPVVASPTPLPTHTPVPPSATPTVAPPSATFTPAPTATATTPPTATPLPPAPPRPAPTATATTALKPIVWDTRLTARGAYVIPAQRQAGQGYWRLVRGQWFDVNDEPFAGKHHIFVDVLDAAGNRLVGAPVRLAATDVRTIYGYLGTEAKPGEPYAGSFVMSEIAPAYRVEPSDGAPAEAVAGLGLGTIEFPAMAMLTSYGLTWQWTPPDGAGSGAPTAGGGPDQALRINGAQQFMSAGQRIWYAFHYAGDNSPIIAQMSVNPPDAIAFSVWTQDDVQRWVQEKRENPTGRGAPNEGARGALVWVGNFNVAGVYYIVVDQTGQYTGSFTLAVTGTGVSPAGQ